MDGRAEGLGTGPVAPADTPQYEERRARCVPVHGHHPRERGGLGRLMPPGRWSTRTQTLPRSAQTVAVRIAGDPEFGGGLAVDETAAVGLPGGELLGREECGGIQPTEFLVLERLDVVLARCCHLRRAIAGRSDRAAPQRTGSWQRWEGGRSDLRIAGPAAGPPPEIEVMPALVQQSRVGADDDGGERRHRHVHDLPCDGEPHIRMLGIASDPRANAPRPTGHDPS